MMSTLACIQSQAPRDYYTDKLVGDVVGVVEELKHDNCTLVSHDW